MTTFLTARKEIQTAASIAKTFRMDPVEILNASPFEWAVRIAAHNVIMQHEKEEAARMKSKSSRSK